MENVINADRFDRVGSVIMRIVRTVLLIVAVTWPGMALAAKPIFAVPDTAHARSDLATLIFPESLDIEMVDGFVYPGFKTLFRRGDTEMRILPGNREVALRYNMLFDAGSNDHDIVKSKVMVLAFVAEPGKTYRATHDVFRDARAAREGTKNFVVKIEDEQGSNRVLGASQISKNWQGEATTTTRKDLVSVLAAESVAVANEALLGAGQPAAGAASGSLDMLKYAWGHASAEERAAFVEWISPAR